MKRSRGIYFVYVLTNNRGSLYVGVTNNIFRRLWEHKKKLVPGFTSRYNISKLLYFESYGTPTEAIEREKQLKRWSRVKKIDLIRRHNPLLGEILPPWE